MEIIKSSGEKEVFERDKLCSSIAAAGAPADLVQKVCELVAAKIKPGDTSSEIYREAFRWLVKEDLNTAVNYSLRKALAELGPAGFVFEQYLEVLLQAYGWETKRNVQMQGECIDHEVDIFAKKDGEHRLIEAKYHHERNLKTRGYRGEEPPIPALFFDFHRNKKKKTTTPDAQRHRADI